MTKGSETRLKILDCGLEMGSKFGLESITIGGLAKQMSMSKTSLFAHFNSKENLQIAILSHAGEKILEVVVRPSLQKPSGISQLLSFRDNWLVWESGLAGGCIFLSSASEFSERPGKVRDFLLSQHRYFRKYIADLIKGAIDTGDFRSDIDADMFAFEIYSKLLGFHLNYTMLKDLNCKSIFNRAFQQMLDKYRTAV